MKILFLQKRILFPTDTGGKIRTLNVVRHLARWHDVTYLCNVQQETAEDLQKMRDLGVELVTVPWKEAPRESPAFYMGLARNLFSRYPFNVNKDYDPRLRKRAEELLNREPFDLVICDFVQMARNAIGLNAPAQLLFQHNVEAQIFERHSKQDRGWLRRQYMRLQWKKMQRFEGMAGQHFEAVVAVSEQDRQKYKQDYGWDHVHTIDTAVDVDYFHPNGTPEKSDRVVFVGSMDWLPNQDGIRHFVENTWPAVRKRRPRAEFQVVGRNPSRSVQQLDSHPGVKIVGGVPDVRPYLAEAAVVVVPLLVGGGTRLKIFEAMAMQKAMVSTTLGAEGLDVTSGEHLYLEDSPSQFAAKVVELLENGEERQRIAGRARQLVLERYSAERVARQFEAICEKALQKQSHARDVQ